MRVEQFVAALRRPVIKRLRMRRSTVIMVGLFVVLAGLQAYHNYDKPPSSTTICIGDHCAPATTHNGSSGTSAHSVGPTTTTSDPLQRGAASTPRATGNGGATAAGATSKAVVTSAIRATSGSTISGG